jgi:protein TonB
MVHATHPAFPSFHPIHPDARRIAGMAAAIVLNAGLLMLLMLPMRAPSEAPLPDRDPDLRWILPRTETPRPPIVPVVPHRAPATPSVVPRPLDITPPVAPVIVDNDPMQSQTPDTDETVQPPQVQPTLGDGGPVAGVHLEYADAPAPVYPRDALLDGAEGTVLLQVLVDVDGAPLRVDVQRSSGDRRLDLAARKQVLQHWRFRPAMKDGHAVQAIGLVPIDFHLQ